MKTLVICSALLLALSACHKEMPVPDPCYIPDDSWGTDDPGDPGDDDPGYDPGDPPSNPDPGDDDPGYDDPGGGSDDSGGDNGGSRVKSHVVHSTTPPKTVAYHS